MSGSISDWFDYNQKNKPQSNALAGGIILMMVSGVQIGWIFNNQIFNLQWTFGHSTLEIIFTYVSFYIAVIVGLYAALIALDRLTKRNIYFAATALVTIGSIPFIATPNNLYLILVARVFIGLGHGYAYLTVIVHASEIMTQNLRGMLVSTLNYLIFTSVFLCGSLTLPVDEDFEAFQWFGITTIIFCIMSFIFIPIFTRESPVALIKQKKYNEALSLMIRVRCESNETWTIRNEFNELKAMVEEDEQSSSGIFDEGNLRPLMFITLLKIGFVLSFNYGLNMIRLNYSTVYIGEETNSTVMVLMGIRMVAGLITLFTIDSKGRKPHFYFAFGGSSILLIVMAVVAAFDPTDVSWPLEILQILYEIAGGIGMGMISDVYSSEAFNTTKKPKSIFFSSSVEFFLQAVIIAVTFNVTLSSTYSWIYLTASGVLLLAITAFLFKKLPETAKMSIRQSRNEFVQSGEIVFSGSKMPTQNITFS